jgi:murein DD-endopeptidase MepM/ murein hydrolase activator NlpD
MIKLKNILIEDASNLLQTFPIGSKNFNVGYDADTMSGKGKTLRRDKATHNSDFGGGDAAHQSRGGHRGIDIFAPTGEPVVAPVTGIVVKVSKQDVGPGGKTVTIEKDGYSFYHAHLDQVYVDEGQEVNAGHLIGVVGDTGNAAGTHPHVHFSIYKTADGYMQGTIDPWPSLKDKLYNLTKSDKNLETVHKKLKKLGFDLGDEVELGTNGPKTQEALKKLETKYKKSQEKGSWTDKARAFVSGIIDSDIARSILGKKEVEKAPEVAPKIDNLTSMPNKVITFFKNKGLSTSQASGIAGNLSIESQFNPGAVGDSGTSYGLAQWHASRWDALKDWSMKNGRNPGSFEAQLEYLWHELENKERTALNQLKLHSNPADAAYAFAKYFERPSKISQKRITNAENYYNEYTKDVIKKIA